MLRCTIFRHSVCRLIQPDIDLCAHAQKLAFEFNQLEISIPAVTYTVAISKERAGCLTRAYCTVELWCANVYHFRTAGYLDSGVEYHVSYLAVSKCSETLLATEWI